MSNTLCLIVTLLLLPLFLLGQIQEVPFTQRIQASEVIVEGKVIKKESFWDINRHNIYTRNEIEVYKVFKGRAGSDTIEIITYGGQVENAMDLVDHSLQLNIGEIGIFTVHQNQFNVILPGLEHPTYFPYADVQGFVKYDLINNEARDHFEKYRDIEELYERVKAITATPVKELKPLPMPNLNPTRGPLGSITGFNPASIPAGTGSVLTVFGTGFGATRGAQAIYFSNADDGGSSLIAATTYNSWSDTQIEVVVPTQAGTGNFAFFDGSSFTSASPFAVTIPYARLTQSTTLSQPRHVNQNGIDGYDFSFHIDYYNTAGAVEAFNRALRSWLCLSGIAFTPINTATTDVSALDGINIIRFDNGAELPPGILGRLTNRYRFVGGDWYVQEIDLVMDDGTNWNYSTAAPSASQHDFESVTLHELGHAHQMGHVIDGFDVMNFSISTGTQRRAPNSNNSTAATFIIGQATTQGVNTPKPMVTKSCPAATDAEFFSSRQVVYTDQDVTFTDVSFGTVTSRSWDLGDSKTANTAEVTTSYSTPGIKTIRLTINGSVSETKTIKVLPLYRPTYSLGQGGDFESNPDDFGGDGIGGRFNIWERGTPSNFLNQTAGGSNVWKTDLDADISRFDGGSALYSPAFIMSQGGTYIFSMDIAMENTFANGPFGVVVEYTTDNGSTWTQLGAPMDGFGFNWINSTSSSVTPSGGTWAFTSSSFFSSIYDISFLRGTPKVGFRIAYYITSNFTRGYAVDGFAIDGFSVSSSASLPVELTTFKARKDDKSALLSWETATETNNERFIVLRSNDGIAYKELGQVKGAGNSLEPQQYQFWDDNPVTGKNYYRLKQIDFDGTFEYSGIQIVEFEDSESKIQVYPNPVYNEGLNILLPFDRSNVESLQVLDVTGKQFQTNIEEGAFENKFVLNTSQLPAGIYLIQINLANGQMRNERFIKR